MSKPYVYHRAEDLGIPVVDSKERTYVAVTADDVIRAKKADSKHCALARASLRLPGVQGAYFFRTVAFLEYEDKMVKYELPLSAQREIVSFDRAQIFAPGAYQLSSIRPERTQARRAKLSKTTKATRSRKVRISTPNERRSLSVAIAKVAAAENKKPETPEERQFERQISRLEAVVNKGKKPTTGRDRSRKVVGAVKPGAPMPLHSGGSSQFHRRSQYVRDLREPE